MIENYKSALAAVLKYEGFYSSHPQDPGGSTMRGVTQATYDGWRKRHGLPVQSVRNISQEELEQIYRRDFWDVIRGDDLPGGLDLCVFDYAVNSGPSRAVKALQRVLGVPVDGIVGPQTLAAANANPKICGELCDARLRFMQGLKIWPTFGKGWSSRVADVRKKSLALAAKAPTVPVVVGKAIPHVEEKTIIDEVLDTIDWTRHSEEAARQVPTSSSRGSIGMAAACVLAIIGALQNISGAQWDVALSTPNHEGLEEIGFAVVIAVANLYLPHWVTALIPRPRSHA